MTGSVSSCAMAGPDARTRAIAPIHNPALMVLLLSRAFRSRSIARVPLFSLDAGPGSLQYLCLRRQVVRLTRDVRQTSPQSDRPASATAPSQSGSQVETGWLPARKDTVRNGCARRRHSTARAMPGTSPLLNARRDMVL